MAKQPARKAAPRKTGAARPRRIPQATGSLYKVGPAGGRHYGGGSTPVASGSTGRKLPSPTAATTKIRVAKKAAPSRPAPARARSGGGGGSSRSGSAPQVGRTRARATAAVDAAQPELAPILDRVNKAHEKVFGGFSNMASSVGNRLLLAEFVICMVILGVGTIIAPAGSARAAVPRLMLKSTAFAGVFLILGLTSATGPKGARAAAGLGGLVTLAYAVTSPDATSILSWISKSFAPAAAGTAAGEGVGSVAAGLGVSSGGAAAGGAGGGLAGAAAQGAA